MKLNGWQRLWVVVSVLWWLYALYYLTTMFLRAGLPRDWLDFAILATYVVLLVIPPFLVYGAALVVRWVIRGFRPGK